VPIVHHVLVMTVNPGFGGRFYPKTVNKVANLRSSESNRTEFRIEVDGRLRRYVATVVKAGAELLVADRRSLNAKDRTERKALSETGACSCQSLTVGLHYG